MQRLPFLMVVMLLNRHYTCTLTILIFRFLFPIPRLRLDIGVLFRNFGLPSREWKLLPLPPSLSKSHPKGWGKD